MQKILIKRVSDPAAEKGKQSRRTAHKYHFTMANSKTTGPVTVKIPKGQEKTAESLKLYLVDKQGAVIESHSLKSGEVTLSTKASDLHGAKTYIAPALPAELSEVPVTEKTLLNMGAWQPSVRLSEGNVYQIPYFPHFPFPLPFGWCNVTGTVTKTFTVNGTPEVLPVCNAIVHICDVERIRFLIDRIPVDVLNDLKYRLTNVISIPVNGPNPAPKVKANFGTAANQFAALAAPAAVNAQLPDRPALPENVQRAILTGNLQSFRTTLVNNFELFHPYFCWWPWFWPWFYDFDEVATVITDCNGAFNYNMLYFLKNHPNVYIWVEAYISGVLTTIYNPWISCNTYWNYACGTNINITVTDPGILPCFCENSGGAEAEGSFVWIEDVNGGVSVRGIQQFETPSGHLANAVGLTAYGTYGNISPFAAGFSFVVQFGDGLATSGVTHYRWSYTQQTDAYLTNVSDTKHYLGGAASKSYSQWVEITPGNWGDFPGSVSLGPVTDSGGNPMYQIPNSDASVETGLPNAIWDTGLDTASINVLTSASGSSAAWNPGLYEFTIELLDNAGNVVPLSSNPFTVTRLASDPPSVPPGEATIDAQGLPEDYLITDASGNVIGFNFLMRIDNDLCYAGISDALVAGNTTDTECGTGYYNNKNTDVVDLYFQAGHPHNFATYGFAVYKGNSGAVSIAASSGTSANANNVTPATAVTAGNNGYDISQIDPPAIPPVPANPVNPVSGMDQYHKSILVSDMLGSCTMAAFSEIVNVYCTHTDGSDPVDYDASYIAAIAIGPNS